MNEAMQIYQNKSLLRISKRRRLATILIDFICLSLFYLCLFYSIGTLSIRSQAKSDIENINLLFEELCVDRDYPVKAEGSYGFYEIDMKLFLHQYLESNPSQSEEKAYETYFEAVAEMKKELLSHDRYVTLYSSFQTKYLFTVTWCFLIPQFLFLFLIPLVHPRKKSIGKMILHVSLLEEKTGNYISSLRLLTRFIILFFLSFFLRVLFGNLEAVIGFLVVFISIMLSYQRKSIYDYPLQLIVLNDASIASFKAELELENHRKL